MNVGRDLRLRGDEAGLTRGRREGVVANTELSGGPAPSMRHLLGSAMVGTSRLEAWSRLLVGPDGRVRTGTGDLPGRRAGGVSTMVNRAHGELDPRECCELRCTHPEHAQCARTSDSGH